MTIGIAIPTYYGHAKYLSRLLGSIAQSTVLPSTVAISASEIAEPNLSFSRNDYPFKIYSYITSDKLNTAENSNMALAMLDTDILSIIGGDDMVHPQRNEFLLRAFENKQIDVVVHNFLQSDHIDEDFLNTRYDLMELYVGYIDTLFPNIPYPTNKKEHLDFANGFVSFRAELFDTFQYDESPEAEYIEDSLFNRMLVESGHSISYIKQKLALYLKNPIRPPK